MARREISPEDAEAFGKRIYEEKVRPTISGGEEPIGYFLSFDFDSGDWEIDESRLEAPLRLLARKPDADVFTVKVGYPAAGEWAKVNGGIL